MRVKPGTRLKSAVGTTEVIVVRAPADDVDLRCGGHPMLDNTANAPADLVAVPEHMYGTSIGKRYADESQALELLCTKGGGCSLAVGMTPLQPKEAKPLPASD